MVRNSKSKTGYITQLLRAMQLFTEWIDKTPNELLLEAEDDIRKGLLMQNHRNKRAVLNLYYNKIGHEDKKNV